MANGEFRKSLFGGFNKTDVLQFVAGISSENAKNESDLKERLDHTAQKHFELEKQVAETTKKYTSLCASEKAEKQKNAELYKQISALNETVRALREENIALKTQQNDIQSDLAAISRQKEEYDLLITKCGQLCIAAEARVNDIIEEAKRQAEQIKSDKSAQIFEKMMDEISGAEVEIDKIRSTLKHIVQRIDVRFDEMRGNLKNYKKELD